MLSTPLSGLAGIAGSILPGPEGQGSAWTRGVQNRMTYEPRTSGGQAATEAVTYPFRKIGEAADWAGGQTTDLTGSPAAGAAVNTGIQAAIPLAASRAIPFAKGSETAQGRYAARLLQSAVKPDAADIKSGAAGRAMNTMLEERIDHSPAGMHRLHGTVSGLNSEVEAAIHGSPASVNVARVGSRLRAPYDNARNQVNPTADVNTVRGVWDEFRRSPQIVGRTEIPVQAAHELKKGTYRSLGGKSYGEIGSASTEAQKALARGLREEVAANVPGVVAPLQREASLMNVLDVAERKALQQANNNPFGLSPLASNPYAGALFMMDRWGKLKSKLAQGLYTTGTPGFARGATTSSAMGQQLQAEPEFDAPSMAPPLPPQREEAEMMARLLRLGR
jgi:hypothetical protein